VIFISFFTFYVAVVIEPGRSYIEYSFLAHLSGSEVVDDMRKAMVDFPDDYRPTISSIFWFSRMVPDLPMDRDSVDMFLNLSIFDRN
jgi:hypothetical protein